MFEFKPNIGRSNQIPALWFASSCSQLAALPPKRNAPCFWPRPRIMLFMALWAARTKVVTLVARTRQLPFPTRLATARAGRRHLLDFVSTATAITMQRNARYRLLLAHRSVDALWCETRFLRETFTPYVFASLSVQQLYFFSNAALKRLSFVWSLPRLQAVKTNVCIGKLNNQTFHVVGRVRAGSPWKFIDAPPRLRTTAVERKLAKICSDSQ